MTPHTELMEQEERKVEIVQGGDTATLIPVPATQMEAITRAEVDVQIATAQKFPRIISRFLAEGRGLATLDEETAASCIYTLPRDGKNITGPSVRLAEIAAYSFGHLRIASRIAEIGESDLTAVCVAHDLQRNVAVGMEVKRRIQNKHGKRYNEDMIVMTANAAQKIAYRNSVFAVIPRAFINQIYAAAREVATGKGLTLAAKREKTILWLKAMVDDLSDERIFNVLEGVAKLDDLSINHLEHLIGLGTAIKSGERSPEEAFPLPQSRPKPPVNGGGAKPESGK